MIEKINEIYHMKRNDDVLSKINEFDLRPYPLFMIGDEARIRKDAIDFYEDEIWMDVNNIGYEEDTLDFLKYCVQENIELKVIGKFKGDIDESYPWWSIVNNDYNPYDDNNTITYIPDLFFENPIKTPNLKPKTFIYEEAKELMYFNDVKESPTKWKYRFKTREEFVEEYGRFWMDVVHLKWVDEMDYLFGTNVDHNIDFDSDDRIVFQTGAYNISMDMIKENNLLKITPNLNPKTFIYETNIEKLHLDMLVGEAIVEFEKDCDNVEENIEDFLEYYNNLYENKNEKLISIFEENIRKQEFNMLVVSKDDYDLEKKLELIILLNSLGIGNTKILNPWKWNDHNQCFLVIFDNYGDDNTINLLDKNWVYSSATNWTQQNITVNYPTARPTPPLSLKESIDFINRITKNFSSLLKPKQFIYENSNKYPYRFIVVVFDNVEELIEFKDNYSEPYHKISDDLLSNSYPYFNRGQSIYYGYEINDNIISFDGWCYVDYLSRDSHLREGYNFEKLFKFEDVKRGLFNQILTTGIYRSRPNLNPKKFIYENSNKYFDKIEKLNVNTILIDREHYNEEYKYKLLDYLDKMGVEDSSQNILNWNYSMPEHCFLITLNNCDTSSLGKNMVYTSGNEYITSGGLGREYPSLKCTELLNLEEAIDFIKTKILITRPNLNPRKFIYESNIWYPYRFKTEEEMISNYGDGWQSYGFGESGWNSDMNSLLGEPYPYQENQLNKDSRLPRTDRFYNDGNDWEICWEMLTKNEKRMPNLHPKTFVYESKKHHPYRFKTEEEFINEYGISWQNNISSEDIGGCGYCWVSSMNYLLGTDLIYDFNNSKDYITIPRVGDSGFWYITRPMITENKPPTPIYSPRKFVYESDQWYPYRFKTEKEMEKDFGEDWGNSSFNDHGWNPDMNSLLGKVYPFTEEQLKRSYPRFSANGSTWSIDKSMLTDNKPNKPNLNPRKFIYETKSYKNKVIFLPQTDEDVIEAQKFAFKNGYEWSSGKKILFHSLDECKIMFFKNNQYMLKSERHWEEKEFKEYKDSGFEITNSIMRLKKLIGDIPNYMLSAEERGKRFIYENKVKKLGED